MDKPLVFITGGTGFIGAHVIHATIKAGYRVRASIRKPEQEPIMKNRYSENASNLETIVIPDLTKRKAFVEALKDVDYVFHIASPMPGGADDFKTGYVELAVKGTEAVLYDALQFPQIKKVMVMSSIFGLVGMGVSRNGPLVIKENTGEKFDVDLDMKFPEGIEGHGLKYRASKVLAHQVTRDFREKEKPHFAIVTFHPGYVMGKDLTQTSAAEIKGMQMFFMMTLSVNKPMFGGSWCHVRDVATAHIEALEVPVVSGTEFILCGPPVHWEDVVNFIKKQYPSVECKLEPPFGPPSDVQATAAESVLGMEWTPKENIIQDVLDQQLAFQTDGN